MARTTDEEVRLILDTNLSGSQLGRFISDASLWVDNNLAGEGLSDATLEAIECWLAAGFATAREAKITGRGLKSVRESFQRDPKVSEYFKRAADLDPTGTVAGMFLPNRRRGILRVGAGYDSTHKGGGI